MLHEWLHTNLSALSGAAGGTAAGITGAGLTKVVYKSRYNSWLKENGGRYVIEKISMHHWKRQVQLEAAANNAFEINP